MTKIEEGCLSLANEIQWLTVKYRIGTSQVAVMNRQSINNQQNVRVCNFFKEG